MISLSRLGFPTSVVGARRATKKRSPPPGLRRPPSASAMAAGTLGLAATAGGSFLRPWSATLGCGGCGGSFTRGDRPPLRCERRRSLGAIGISCDDKARWRVAVCCSGRRTQGVEEGSSWMSSDAASPYQILGVDPSCSPAQLKAAFRARVKEFHPDVRKDIKQSDAIIRRVIQAYEILSKYHKSEAPESESLDPFEEPECVAADVFVNEILCVGKACPYSCVKMAPHAFSFSPDSGAARAVSQGHDEDYRVQLAVGQCPRRCIHYVTPLQREILEETLQSILCPPYDAAEADVLDSLVAKANFENNRFRKPKKQPKVSTEYVDWL